MIGVEGVFVESLVAGVLILAMLGAVVAYGWFREEWAHREWAHRGMEGHQPLKKAA